MHDTTEADFRAYMTARWPRLLRTAYLLTGHHHDAEDLAQAALTRAYSRWSRVSSARDPDAYVWRVMINLHRDRRRRASVRDWVTSWLPEQAREDRSEQVAARSALLEALRRLPAGQRAVIVLRYLEDRGEREVAEVLGCGVGTVRSQAARGLAKLREDGALRDFSVRETNRS